MKRGPIQKSIKRAAAEERQAIWDALTDKQKIARVRARCGHTHSREEQKIKAAGSS